MIERRLVKGPVGEEIDISNVPVKIADFIELVYKRMEDPDFSKSDYGHATMTLATASIGRASGGYSDEEQTSSLREFALEMVAKFGPAIIPKLREDLKLVLTTEDLRVFESKVSKL